MAEEDRPSGPWAWLRARPSLVAFLAYLGLAVLFFWPGLVPGHTVSAADYLWNAAPWTASVPSGVPIHSLHPHVIGSNPDLVDAVTVFEPFLQYTGSQLPHVPLWNPYIMGGAPYLADMQSAIFSPFSLPAYILPFWWSLAVIATLKVLVASMGAYSLGRLLTMRQGGAFLCGLVFGFGLFMVAWIPWPLTNVFALIPWMLVATERIIRRPGAPWACVAAVLVALQFFGGHPESSVYAVYAMVGYFVLRVLQGPNGVVAAVKAAARHRGSRVRALVARVWRPAAWVAFALTVGTALAAVAIVPFLELLKNSSDLNTRPRSGVHIPVNYSLGVFLPHYFVHSFTIETGLYVGALALMLAIIALFRPRVERVVFAAVAVLSLAVVLGLQPFFLVATHIPGLDFTYLSRFTIVYLLCVALLSGWGFDDVVGGLVRGRRAQAAVAVAVVSLVVPVVVVAATGRTSLHYLGQAARVAWLFAASPDLGNPRLPAVFHLTAVLVWITVAGVALVLLCLRLGRRISGLAFALLALTLVVGDLFQAGMGYNPAITQSQAVQPVTPAIRFLQAQRPARFVAVTPYAGVNPLPPNVNMRYGLYDLRGYDLPVIAQFGNVWRRYVAPPNPLLPLDTPSVPLTITNNLTPQALKVLALFGVRDVLVDPKAPVLHIDGLHVVYSGSDATIYADRNALPRSWVVSDQVVVGSESRALHEIVAPSFHPMRAVITEHPVPGLSNGSEGSTAGAVSRITSYSAQRVVLSVRTRHAGEAILSDTYYPGWKATVNGRPVPINRVDYLLRGVAVPAGVDRVVFTYDPTSYRVGVIVSVLALVVIAAALLLAARSRWKRRNGRISA
jgi:hypothetical protein